MYNLCERIIFIDKVLCLITRSQYNIIAISWQTDNLLYFLLDIASQI